MTSVEEDIIHSYTFEYDEATRLSTDIGPLEFVRTQELIRRYIPSPPAVVLDIGGAAGPYAFWLASLGYSVHLLDIVPRHIERAQAIQAQATSVRLAGIHLGDARKLPFEDSMADVTIVHGPLYHLPEHADRIRTLTEARRVLKPNGLVLAFGITRYAGLIYGITTGRIFEPEYRHMIATEVRTGHRLRSAKDSTCFRSAYFHLPAELEAEVRQAGMLVECSRGILGPAWQVPDLERSWADPAKREAILELAELVEQEPILGPRFVVICRRVA